jgi:hypothetical protein
MGKRQSRRSCHRRLCCFCRAKRTRSRVLDLNQGNTSLHRVKNAYAALAHLLRDHHRLGGHCCAMALWSLAIDPPFPLRVMGAFGCERHRGGLSGGVRIGARSQSGKNAPRFIPCYNAILLPPPASAAANANNSLWRWRRNSASRESCRGWKNSNQPFAAPVAR